MVNCHCTLRTPFLSVVQQVEEYTLIVLSNTSREVTVVPNKSTIYQQKLGPPMNFRTNVYIVNVRNEETN